MTRFPSKSARTVGFVWGAWDRVQHYRAEQRCPKDLDDQKLKQMPKGLAPGRLWNRFKGFGARLWEKFSLHKLIRKIAPVACCRSRYTPLRYITSMAGEAPLYGRYSLCRREHFGNWSPGAL